MANGLGAHGVPSGQRKPGGNAQPERQSAHDRVDALQEGPVWTDSPRAAGQRAAQGGYRPLTSEASRYSHYNDRYRGKKRHAGRNALVAVLVIIVLVGAAGGYTGYTLYNSAKQVRSDASVVMSDLSDLKGQIIGEQGEQAGATARDIAARAANMKGETSGWEWKVARFAPVYGGDVAMVADLADVLDTLAQDAIVPLVGEASQISSGGLLSDDGSINVELAGRLVNALDSAAPVISACAERVENMGEARLEQVAKPLEKAKEQLAALDSLTRSVQQVAPTFTQMLGADGQSRTYLIVAQNNSEIRSTGGFLGSVGPLYVTDGHIELGSFRTIYDIYPSDLTSAYAPITDEELGIFGLHVSFQIADSNFIPDFSRVAEIVKFAWEEHGLGSVQGVIGIDPVCLQDMLALAGSVTASNGTEVDGANAARVILRDTYYLPPELQDPFFEEVAALSFKQLLSNIGSIPLTQLADAVNRNLDARHLQVWMENESEEAAIAELGGDGRISHDEESPVLGVYFAEESYSKLFWYMKSETEVGEPISNADGSKTYPIAVRYWNMLSAEEEQALPAYTASHNSIARSQGDMITWIMLSAPEGGYIDGMLVEGDFVPESVVWRDFDAYHNGSMIQTSYQGVDFWYGLSWTQPGGACTVRFNVTVSPNATEPLKVVTTPTAQAAAGW